jgi:hypothetical protein
MADPTLKYGVTLDGLLDVIRVRDGILTIGSKAENDFTKAQAFYYLVKAEALVEKKLDIRTTTVLDTNTTTLVADLCYLHAFKRILAIYTQMTAEDKGVIMEMIDANIKENMDAIAKNKNPQPQIKVPDLYEDTDSVFNLSKNVASLERTNELS